jgi:hypothetical protein
MVQTSVIERGDGWTNIVARVTGILTNKLYLTPLRAAVDSKSIELYSTSLEQRQLFAMTTNYWRTTEPYLTAEDDGYNVGNALLGLDASFGREISIINLMLISMEFDF